MKYVGDIVRAVIPHGKYAGVHVECVAVRGSGSFNITTAQGAIQRASYKYCKSLHRMDGYSYQKGELAFPPNP